VSRNKKAKNMSDENQPQFDFLGHIVNIEDAEKAVTPAGENKTFTDEELNIAGLIKTSAFVRSNRSKNALRVEKHKNKKEEIGIKQLNVEVPDEHRESMKQLAIALKHGLTLADAMKAMLSNTNLPDTTKTPKKAIESVSTDDQINYARIGEEVALIRNKGGLKAFILNRLIKEI
jgi:hypothetical protein